MKNYGEIRVTQRTAVGKDDSGQTKLYVMTNVRTTDQNDVEIMTLKKAKSYAYYDGSHYAGYITVIHPYVMAGSWEEVLAEFIRMAYDKLEEDGIIEPNGYGIYFLTEQKQRV